MLDCESLPPRKKSDSSLSAGAGEVDEDDDRESSRSSAGVGLGLAATEGVAAAAILSTFEERSALRRRENDSELYVVTSFGVIVWAGLRREGNQGSQG